MENLLKEIKKRNRETKIGFIILIIIIILLFLWLRGIQLGIFYPNQSEWQAVFLDNGQVYFGKIKTQNRYEVILSDIYYLQTEISFNKPENKENQPEISLVKLGNEIHGPMDIMRINREHILFIEDLKPSSKIIKAINQK